jgi:hypothetical protein
LFHPYVLCCNGIREGRKTHLERTVDRPWSSPPQGATTGPMLCCYPPRSFS